MPKITCYKHIGVHEPLPDYNYVAFYMMYYSVETHQKPQYLIIVWEEDVPDTIIRAAVHASGKADIIDFAGDVSVHVNCYTIGHGCGITTIMALGYSNYTYNFYAKHELLTSQKIQEAMTFFKNGDFKNANGEYRLPNKSELLDPRKDPTFMWMHLHNLGLTWKNGDMISSPNPPQNQPFSYLQEIQRLPVPQPHKDPTGWWLEGVHPVHNPAWGAYNPEAAMKLIFDESISFNDASNEMPNPPQYTVTADSNRTATRRMPHELRMDLLAQKNEQLHRDLDKISTYLDTIRERLNARLPSVLAIKSAADVVAE